MGVVHSAAVSDSAGARLVLEELAPEDFPRMKKVWADRGYRGPLAAEFMAALGWELEVVSHTEPGESQVWIEQDEQPPPLQMGFKVLKWRWIVERTLAWLSRNRRLAKDFEATIASSTAWLNIGMISLMLRRLS